MDLQRFEKRGTKRMEIVLELYTNQKLPINYNRCVQAQIYRFIDPLGWHDNGYKGHKFFRPFSFSRLIGNFYVSKGEKILVPRGPFRLHVKSPAIEFIETFLENLEKVNTFQIGNVNCQVLMQTVHDVPTVRRDVIDIQTLSPICIPKRNEKGQFKATYHTIDLEKWLEHFKHQLCKHYNWLHGDQLNPLNPQGVSLSITQIWDVEKTVAHYHGGCFTGFNIQARLQGDPRLLNQALQLGIGSYLPRGFGMIERI